MSDLSDQLNAALESVGHKDDEKGTFVNTDDAEWIKEVPGYAGFAHYNARTVVKLLRRVYRKDAGRAAPDTPQEALDRTTDLCTKSLVPLVSSAFADGVQIGHGVSHPVKKFDFFKKIDEVFEHEGFREESELFQVSISMDYDASEVIERYFKAAVTMVAAASGFMAITEKQGFNRVWDLWALSTNSASTGMFLAGVFVGKQWKEKDTLAGILSATEKDE